ncbi:MAG TPA: ABC transporter ATP-binding protein [Planktothrix sp.]|jgi:ATP-binding cassette subfamily B protein
MQQINGRSRILRALGFLSPYWKNVILILFLTLLTSAVNSVEPMVQKLLIDALTTGGSTVRYAQSLMGSVMLTIALLVLLAIARETVGGLSNYLSWRLRLRTNHKILDSAVGKIYSLSLSFHQNETIGSIMTRLDRGITGFSSVLFDITLTLLPSLLYLACTIVFMFMMDARLAWVALFFAPLPALIGIRSSKISAEREKQLLSRWMCIYSRFHEGLNLIKTVKSFLLENGEQKRFLNAVEDTNELVRSGVKIDAKYNFLKDICMDAGRLAVLSYGAYLIVHHEITIGTLVAFLAYTGSLFGPMLGLAGMYETLRKARVYVDTIFDIIDTADSVSDRTDAREMPTVRGAIEFDHVAFAYRGDRPVLKDTCFQVQPGSMVALVGPSGSGKTTIVDLLNRFYDPQIGRVLLDGVDVRELKQKSLRSHIGMVLQDTALFNDTIKNNIACARPDASDDEIARAARAAGADRFIEKKPEGYATQVGERGVLLSGGERQRIAIARAILKDPQIFIFDEASSNLDAESEELVQQAITELAKTKTVFVIAHRLSTIRKADLILVLRGGEIVEQGRHDELVEKGGLYHKLVAVQAISLHSDTIQSSDFDAVAPSD